MGNIEARPFIVDEFEFIQTWIKCRMYDPGDDRHPDVILNNCGHPCLPFDARYRWSHVIFDVSFSRSPTGKNINVGQTRSVAEFETTFENIADEAYNVGCMGAEGYELYFTVESDCLPDWITESDDVYATVELTYDEELTKAEEGFTDEEIEHKREEFQAHFDEWDLEYGPDAMPRP
ncbi:hypothetical protein HTG_14435 [Natrinema mahii]|nr:hypothetical protein HTG_14435 [Natrinema mahii]